MRIVAVAGILSDECMVRWSADGVTGSGSVPDVDTDIDKFLKSY
jgi:hypothetical protein